MSITAIPNQPIAFNGTDLKNVVCPGPEEELLFTPVDDAVAQFLLDPCDPVQQLASPAFEDPDDWYSTTWDIRPNDACITGGTGTINDTSFSPTAGLPYIITVIVTSLLRPKELEVTFGGMIPQYISAPGVYTWLVIASDTNPLAISTDIRGLTTACLSFAGVELIDLDLTVTLVDEEGDPVGDPATFAANPEYFTFDPNASLDGAVPVTFTIPLTAFDVPYGCYWIKVTDGCSSESMTSQKINYGEHLSTLKIISGNAGDGLGFAGGFVPQMRLVAKLVRPRYEQEEGFERGTDGTLNTYFGRRDQKLELRIERTGEFAHDYLSTLFAWDHVYIGGQDEYKVFGEGYEPAYADIWDDHGGIVLLCEKQQSSIFKVRCGPDTGGGFAPPPNYWVQDLAPDGDYILQEDLPDRILLHG